MPEKDPKDRVVDRVEQALIAHEPQAPAPGEVELTHTEQQELLGVEDLVFANIGSGWAQQALFAAVERVLGPRMARAWGEGHDECCAVLVRHCATASNPYRVAEGAL